MKSSAKTTNELLTCSVRASSTVRAWRVSLFTRGDDDVVRLERTRHPSPISVADPRPKHAPRASAAPPPHLTRTTHPLTISTRVSLNTLMCNACQSTTLTRPSTQAVALAVQNYESFASTTSIAVHFQALPCGYIPFVLNVIDRHLLDALLVALRDKHFPFIKLK